MERGTQASLRVVWDWTLEAAGAEGVWKSWTQPIPGDAAKVEGSHLEQPLIRLAL